MRAIRLLAALGLILGSFAFATPVAAGDPCYHGFDLPAVTEGDEPQIKMMPCAFEPAVVRVAPGTTVEWLNDLEDHLITGANQEWGFRDAEIAPREEVAFRFDRPGTYPYACAIHRGMSGVIVVGDGITTKAAPGAAPAVVTVKAPATAKASAEPSAAPVAVAPAARASTAVAAAPIAPASATAPAGTERPGTAPTVVLGAVAFIVATIVAVRLVAARRTGRGVPLEG